MPIDRAALWAAAGAEVDRADPISWNNALMELGALVCTARAAHSDACPWAPGCASRGDAIAIARAAAPLKVAAKRIAYGDQDADPALPRHHVVLALIHHQDRYLVARRRAGSHLGGCWELPGGKRERGEDDRVALARELAEELGAEVLAARSLLRFEHAYPDRVLSFHCFRVRLFNPDVVAPRASAELRWVTPEEFVALEFPPANAPIQARMRRYHRLGRAGAPAAGAALAAVGSPKRAGGTTPHRRHR